MRLLTRPKWIVGHLLVLLVVVAFVRLGFWQLDRHQQLLDRNARVEARLAQPPVRLSELAEADGDYAFRRVTATGRFDPGHELLLRHQTHQGRPGWHVLTPFVLDEPAAATRAVIVDRGWVPQRYEDAPVEDARPPEGRVRIEGVLAPEADPPTGPLARFAPRDPADGPLDRVVRVDVERIALQLPYALVDAVMIPTSVPGAGDAELPVPPEPPAAEAGTHFAYALQWFAFAAIATVGYALLLRHRLREDAEA